MDHFPEIANALRNCGEHLISVSDHLLNAVSEMRQAQTAMVDAVDAAAKAHADRDDLRETVARHEREILNLLDRLNRAESDHG
jgi:hypothetical protein